MFNIAKPATTETFIPVRAGFMTEVKALHLTHLQTRSKAGRRRTRSLVTGKDLKAMF